MNVTKDGLRTDNFIRKAICRRYLRNIEEYVEAFVHRRITENNRIITNSQEENLLERIVNRDNLNRAYRKVKSNKGACFDNIND
jgi:RNA-directed DNA polymerase